MRSVGIRQSRHEVGAEYFKIHRRPKRLKLIAEVAQSLQAIVDIEKAGLRAHRFISDPINQMESEMRGNGEVDASIYTAVSAERTYGGVDFHRIGGAFVA
jgi:hypothetical protein